MRATPDRYIREQQIVDPVQEDETITVGEFLHDVGKLVLVAGDIVIRKAARLAMDNGTQFASDLFDRMISPRPESVPIQEHADSVIFQEQ